MSVTDDTAARLAHLESLVTRLDERRQIEDVYLRYMRGFDRNDDELLRSAFWPEVQINYGTQVNTLDDFVVRHMRQHAEEIAAFGHLLTNIWIDVDGDVAHAEAYVTAFWTQSEGGPVHASGATIASGRYIDRLDRRNGEWRISVREFVGHFSAQTAPPTWNRVPASVPVAAADPAIEETRPRSDRTDLSYRRPLTPRPRESR